MDAALEEFAAKGFAGARVREIAKRAGLNQQLISYYFGGKAGLYDALQRRWNDTSTRINQQDLPLEQVVAGFLHASLANPAWTRLMAWQNLAADPYAAGNEQLMTGLVADIRRRQEAGELAGDLNPAHIALILFAAAAAPTMLPSITRNITGLDPADPAFEDAYSPQLAAVIGHLRPRKSDDAD